MTFVFWVPTIMVNIATRNFSESGTSSRSAKYSSPAKSSRTKHLNHWRRHLPHALFVNLYGPIEISVDCTISL